MFTVLWCKNMGLKVRYNKLRLEAFADEKSRFYSQEIDAIIMSFYSADVDTPSQNASNSLSQVHFTYETLY